MLVHRIMWTESSVITHNRAGYPHYPQPGWYVLWINKEKSVNKIRKKEQKAIAK